ncbi:MAG: tRNA (adenosine(37)-N6)-threonylcarbamoyltransferase complex ATPase subunit type 1 TsaE [Terriglobia bacterium]
MTSTKITTSSPEETLAFGQQLAARLRPPTLMYLDGALGAGKTTLVKGIISGLGLAEAREVRSPSFVFVHVFRNHNTVYHVDLYRIEEPVEAETFGLEDFLAEPTIVIVEWAEKLAALGLVPDWRIHLESLSETQRRIHIEETQPEKGNPR